MAQDLAIKKAVSDLIVEHDEKLAGASVVAQAFKDGIKHFEDMASVQNTYGGSLFRTKPDLSQHDIENHLRKSAWRAAYEIMMIERLAPAAERKKLKAMLDNPPVFDMENIREHFGLYYVDPRFHKLRGLAEVFTGLDPAYKSHSKVKIGVQGLPKRVIIEGFHGYGSWGQDKFKDIINALATYLEVPHMEHIECYYIERQLDKFREFDLTTSFEHDGKHYMPRGVRLKSFLNGNLHIHFDELTQIDINKALAEFYGDVLPDVEEHVFRKRTGTAVSKDLAYYPTPVEVADRILGDLYITPQSRVLEPSCGCGRLLEALRRKGVSQPFGVEYDQGRAELARKRGFNVHVANFLETVPTGDFDYVVMNPPFAGRHYLKHLEHALKFLRPGGTLVAILPASAYFDHKQVQGVWRDLPLASFRESGTNVSTGYLTIRKSEALQQCA